MSESSSPAVGSWSARQTAAATLVIVGVALAFGLAYVFRVAFLLLFVAMVLSIALRPLVHWAERQGTTHTRAVVGIYLSLLLLVLAVFTSTLPLIVNESVNFIESLPEVYPRIRDWLLQTPYATVHNLVHTWPSRLSTHLSRIMANQFWSSLGTASDLAGMLIRGVFYTIAIVLLAFYWSLYQQRSLRSLLMLASPSRRSELRRVIDQLEGKVGAYIRGQGILCAIVGLMSLVAYLIIGLPNAIVLALLAGVLEAIPYFGPVLGAVGPLLVALSVDPVKAPWVLVAAFIVQQTENYILVPRVMDHSVGVNPFVTLLAIAAMGTLLGIPGAVLAIPIAAIVQVLLGHFVLNADMAEPRPAGRDALSVVQYQAHELVQDVRRFIREQPQAATSGHEHFEDSIEAIAADIEHMLAAEVQHARLRAGQDPFVPIIETKGSDAPPAAPAPSPDTATTKPSMASKPPSGEPT